MAIVATDTAETYCEVYWIRRECHNDIFSQGYVGISVKGAAKRFIEHKSAAKSGSTLTVHNAIRKYDDIIVETVLIGSLDYCQEAELKLRPETRIGWNLASGGGQTLLGFKHSDESKKKISENNGSRGRVYSEEERLYRSEVSKQLRHSDETKTHLRNCALERLAKNGLSQIQDAVKKSAYVNMFRAPWENPNADKTTWLLADQAFQMYCEKVIPFHIAKKLNINSSKLSAMIKRFKAGWNPGLCPEWQAFKNQTI